MAQATPRDPTPLNKEISFISRLLLGRQTTVEGTSPEKEPRLDRHRPILSPNGKTPPRPRPVSAFLTPVLTQDTDIENYEEYIELERLSGDLSASRRLRSGRKYDPDYARKLTTVD